eukprot:gene28482-63974_t
MLNQTNSTVLLAPGGVEVAVSSPPRGANSVKMAVTTLGMRAGVREGDTQPYHCIAVAAAFVACWSVLFCVQKCDARADAGLDELRARWWARGSSVLDGPDAVPEHRQRRTSATEQGETSVPATARASARVRESKQVVDPHRA